MVGGLLNPGKKWGGHKKIREQANRPQSQQMRREGSSDKQTSRGWGGLGGCWVVGPLDRPSGWGLRAQTVGAVGGGQKATLAEWGRGGGCPGWKRPTADLEPNRPGRPVALGARVAVAWAWFAERRRLSAPAGGRATPSPCAKGAASSPLPRGRKGLGWAVGAGRLPGGCKGPGSPGPFLPP